MGKPGGAGRAGNLGKAGETKPKRPGHSPTNSARADHQDRTARPIPPHTRILNSRVIVAK